MDDAKQDRSWRGSADLWLDAAYDLLVEGGVEAVKIMPLAARLGLSRTSFYWHFAEREALLAGLIARWQGRNTGVLIAQADAPAATVTAAMLNVMDCWIAPDLFDARLEFAIRTWALTDSDLARTLQAEDEARIAALERLFTRFAYPQTEAQVRAQTVYLTQIGYISMRTQETRDFRLARIPGYVLVFTGRSPSPAEMEVFQARHRG